MNKSYAITIRPTNGIAPKTEKQFLEWAAKQSYAWACIEEIGGDVSTRHIHAQIWFESAREKGTIATAMDRLCARTAENWDKGQSYVMRQGIKHAWSNWFIDYCEKNEEKLKNGECNVIMDNVPKQPHLYYPSEEQQKRIEQRTNEVDKKFQRLEDLILEKFDKTWDPEKNPRKFITLEEVAQMMAELINVDRKVHVIMDKRKRCQTVQSLWRYVNKNDSIDDYLEREHFMRYMEKGGVGKNQGVSPEASKIESSDEFLDSEREIFMDEDTECEYEYFDEDGNPVDEDDLSDYEISSDGGGIM